MIPLLATGAISLASDIVDAWKTHEANVAASHAAKGADFQSSMKVASAQLAAATMRQQQISIPAEAQAAAAQAMQSPTVQGMARNNPGAPVSVQFNANGDLFVAKPGGGLNRIVTTPDVQQELQQLNATLHNPAEASLHGMVQSAAQLYGSRQPTTINLIAA